MGFRLIISENKRPSLRLKGRSFTIRKRGWMSFADELVSELKLNARSAVALYVNEDTKPHTLAFQVASEGNPVAKRFMPRKPHNAGHISNRALVTENAAIGIWNVTGKVDDIYLTDCPCGSDESLDIIDCSALETATKSKRKYTRRTK